MDKKTISKYILDLPKTKLEYPFEANLAVYKVDTEMFAILDEAKTPLRISIKCDPQLAKLLRDKYTEIMPGHKLSKKNWNTIILAGEISWDEVKGLIRHGYELSVKN
ncbi:MmcQ/YjbR family DNA-binding protein [bacterium]|jgi:predicted DNA-binding protein (MmcQ/YjbR family)|nr:MmcQ/YjbR family DNA-binding protein [bacterium]